MRQSDVRAWGPERKLYFHGAYLLRRHHAESNDQDVFCAATGLSAIGCGRVRRRVEDWPILADACGMNAQDPKHLFFFIEVYLAQNVVLMRRVVMRPACMGCHPPSPYNAVTIALAVFPMPYPSSPGLPRSTPGSRDLTLPFTHVAHPPRPPPLAATRLTSVLTQALKHEVLKRRKRKRRVGGMDLSLGRL